MGEIRENERIQELDRILFDTEPHIKLFCNLYKKYSYNLHSLTSDEKRWLSKLFRNMNKMREFMLDYDKNKDRYSENEIYKNIYERNFERCKFCYRLYFHHLHENDSLDKLKEILINCLLKDDILSNLEKTIVEQEIRMCIMKEAKEESQNKGDK